MKVVHINDHYARLGGTETYLFALLDALDHVTVDTAVVHEYPSDIVETRSSVHRIEGLSTAVKSDQAPLIQLREILAAEMPDVIHLHTVDNPRVLATCMATAPTVRSIHNHNVYCPGGMKYFPALGTVCSRAFGPACAPIGLVTHCTSRRPSRLLAAYRQTHRLQHLSRRVGRLLVASEYVRDRMIQNGFAPDTVVTLPYFTALPSPAQWRGEPIVLFTGRVTSYKGLEVLLRSAKFVRVPFEIVVNGDGPALANARRVVEDLALTDRVRFIGWAAKREHHVLYERAAVVVVPSLWPEPFGLVGIEAMSYGKPVVAFDVGGIREWLDHEVTGFLVRPYDIVDMAAKITALLEDRQLADRMGTAGRKSVEDRFSEARHVTALLEVYTAAIAEAHGAAA